MNHEEEFAMQELFSTFDSLDKWRNLSGKDIRPKLGGTLSCADAKISKPLESASDTIRMSLISATQHLNLARDAIQAGQIYLTAHFSTIRGALIGATQAHYILSETTTDAQAEHALQVLFENYDNFRKWANTAIKGDPTNEDLQRISEMCAERCNTAHEQISQLNKGGKVPKLNNTDIIDRAAKQIFHEEEARNLSLFWRHASGNAHALSWPLFLMAEAWTKKPTGEHEAHLTGSITDISTPFLATHRILHLAWEHFESQTEENPAKRNI